MDFDSAKPLTPASHRLKNRVQILKNQRVIADKCFVAMSYFTRLKGLIGRTSLDEGEGMLFPKCNSVVMWFMRIPIDIVFLRRSKSADGTVLVEVTSTHMSAKPWRILPLMDVKGTDALELPEGTIRRLDLKPGDAVCIV